MEDFDLKEIINRTRDEQCVEEALCYGDFRQYHVGEMALDLYAMGFTLVHCPSWHCGGGPTKRSDDGLLEKGVRDTLAHRPQISVYVIVTSDADVIPACQSVKEHDRKLVLYSSPNGVGGLLKSCGFDLREARHRGGTYSQPNPRREQSNGGVLSSTTGESINSDEQHKTGEHTIEKTLIELDRLEKTSRYLTFTYAVGRIVNGATAMRDKVQQQVSNLIKDGVIESYQYTATAIRLNRQHPMVVSSLQPVTGKDSPRQDKVPEMSGFCQSERP
jgi:hypothetical protein